MYWVNILHFYQPPTQDPEVIHQIVKASYEPIVKALLGSPNARFVVNISASLSEWLGELGYSAVIEGLAECARRGQVEFLTSPAYHAILPLISQEESVRQLRRNEEINKAIVGQFFDPSGVFPTEMAYSPEIGKLLASMGYRYLIMDEIGFRPVQQVDTRGSYTPYGSPGRLSTIEQPLKQDVLYSLHNYPNFLIFFRNRTVSDTLSFGRLSNPEDFLAVLSAHGNPNGYIITALDAETFGHHRPGYVEFLFRLYERVIVDTSVRPWLLRDLAIAIPTRVETSPVSSSWSSSKSELRADIPLVLWNEPGNMIHSKQWDLVKLACSASQVSEKQLVSEEDRKKWQNSRIILDKAIHSDQFWWASGYKGMKLGRYWYGKMIERGADLLLQSVQTLPSVPMERKSQGEALVKEIKELVTKRNSNLAMQIGW